MFTFKPYDDSDINGWRKDDLKGDQKQVFHFSVHCDGLEQLDNLLFVRMNNKIIQFFRESEEVSDAERGRVIASISLTNPKDTGNDLLYFAEYTKAGSLIPESCNDDINEFLNRAKDIFKGFPFLSSNKRRGKQKPYDNPDQVFLRLCLLEFLQAVDTHDEVFAITSGYDGIREALRQSKVYLLLCAKLRYWMYCYKGRMALSSEEYSFVVSKFADLLMDKDYNKIVPSDYYDELAFLNNPEIELREILGKKDSKLLEEHIKGKIADFFLTKHAIIESTRKIVRPGMLANVLRGLYFVLMLSFVVWAVYSLMHFNDDVDTRLVASFYENKWWFWVVSAAVAFFEIIPAFLQSKPPVYHPRIVVALLMGWFTIAISEDLIKTQLELKAGLVWTALAVVVFIVGMMLWGEVRQHSPYYSRWTILKPRTWRIRNYPKVTLVLVYAMFWNLLLGMVMQRLTYQSLLEKSGTMTETILGDLPNKTQLYRESVEMCIDMLDDYDYSMEGIIHDYGKINASTRTWTEWKDSVFTLQLSLNAYSLADNIKSDTLIDFVGIHNAYFDQIDSSLVLIEENNADLKEMFQGKHDPVFEPVFELVENCRIVKKDVDINRGEIELNLEKTRKIKNDLRIQLLLIDRFLQEMKSDSRLKQIASVNRDSNNSVFEIDNVYLMELAQNKTKDHGFKRECCWVRCDLFPRMLIFHSLIVLIIAFVGQLIVSDKSVTEPL